MNIFSFSAKKKYLLERYFKKVVEIQWYFQNLSTENFFFFAMGKNNIFSSSIKHRKQKNRDAKLPAPDAK